MASRPELLRWIVELDGIADRLAAGASVADIGCGDGGAAVAIAESFPHVRVYGFEDDRAAIAAARRRAAAAAVGHRTVFAASGPTTYTGLYDLICLLGGLVTLGVPVDVARHARRRLAPDGVVLVVEPDGVGSVLDVLPTAGLGRVRTIAETPPITIIEARP